MARLTKAQRVTVNVVRSDLHTCVGMIVDVQRGKYTPDMLETVLWALKESINTLTELAYPEEKE